MRHHSCFLAAVSFTFLFISPKGHSGTTGEGIGAGHTPAKLVHVDADVVEPEVLKRRNTLIDSFTIGDGSRHQAVSAAMAECPRAAHGPRRPDPQGNRSGA